MTTLDSLDLQNISPEQLGELLIEAKKAYYTTGKPIMDDHTYDTLEEILRQKSPYHRIFSKIGNPNFDTGWAKKKHTMPMGSQNKVNLYQDLIHYFELKKVSSPKLVVQPKCDGVSLEIEYQNGRLVDAITRGDGLIGDVITQNVIKMKNFVRNLPEDLSCSVRCEIVVTKNDFQKLNSLPTSKKESYSNPRNAVSGLAQRLDSEFSDLCTLMAVDIYPFHTFESEKINTLKKLGFSTVDSIICSSYDEVENIYREFLNSKREKYPYDIDGLVVKIDDLSLAAKLGVKNNRPKYQVAYKFPADSNQTQIKNITWQVGPMGSVTPVGEVDPIQLSGAVVTFASLGNYDLVVGKNLNIGDIVEISRRGDVIPHVEKVITKVNPGHIDIPTHCPSCQTLLVKEDKFLRCPNINCLSQILGSLRLFCDTLSVLGLSDKTIAKLYQAKRIRLPGDFFTLTVDDIKDLENLGEKSAKNIIFQIQSKKKLTLRQVFDAAIIPHFSTQRIQQLITSGYDTPQKILSLTVEELESLPGFQKTLAKKVITGIQLRRPWIESILSQVEIKDQNSTSLKFSGLSFAITGDLSQPRPKIIEIIETNGGKFVSAVSKNTNYLLTNETDSSSSKFKTAKKLNIPIINEEKFFQMIKH